MPESIDPHLAVREILDKVMGEPIAALRSSGSGRILQPPQYGGHGLPADEFVRAVCELAAVDGSLGWLAASYNAAAHQITGLPPSAAHEAWDANPDALIAIGHRGSGALVDGRLTGRWESVVGAEQADWLLLRSDHACVLVPRRQVHVEPADSEAGLSAAGVGDVIAEDLAVEDGHVFTGNHSTGVILGAGAAAAVIGSADGVWRKHVDQVRARLDISYGGDEVTDEAAAAVARAASDIDACKLQITTALNPAAVETATWAFAQSVARARGAADLLLASSRHALDASDPVTNLWRDVHAGCRLAMRIIDGLPQT